MTSPIVVTPKIFP